MKILLLAALLSLQGATTVGVKVSGRVVDGTTRRPAVGTVVKLSKGLPLETKTGANGEFEFSGVPAGTYVIRAERAPMLSLPALVRISSRNEEGLGLVLGIPGANGMPSSPVVTIENRYLTYLPTVGVPGSIVLEGGGSLPKADRPISFTLTTSAGGDSAAVTVVPDLQKDGMFRLGMLEGSYKLALRDVPPGYVVKSMRYGSTDLQNAPLQVTTFPFSSIVITLAPERR
jgi:hypothetical protein